MMKQQIKSDFNFIPVFEPFISLSDNLSVLKSLIKKNISGSSSPVKKFEDQFSKFHSRNYGIGVTNGSVALDLAFASLDLEEGDEVILPSHTIISCLASIVRNNGTPVFCDVNSDTWNMTLDDVKKVTTKNTKAVLMVHTFGLPADAINISNFCNENNIYLIEDAAEAHGQTFQNERCGSFGDISTFSFYANKHVTTGEGGMVLTDSENLFKKISQMKNLDFTQKRFQHNNLYWNYRLGGLQASLGLSQLKKLDKIIEIKKKQGRIYFDLLKKHNNLFKLQSSRVNDSENHYWVFGVLLKKENIRDTVIDNLLKKGIETRPFFYPLHLQNALPQKFRNKSVDLKISENLGNNGLYIPLGRHINFSKQKFIVETLIETVKESYS